MLDPEARDRAVAAAVLIAASVGIAALKAIPVFDSEIGRLVALDVLVRATIATLGAGDDFGRDPIATAFLLMFDNDYLLKARIVPSPAGDEYLSVAELIGMDVDDEHLSLANEAHFRGRSAWKDHVVEHEAGELRLASAGVDQVLAAYGVDRPRYPFS